MLERSGQRQGFLVSALLHLVVLMGLAHLVLDRRPTEPPGAEASPLAKRERVFLPPAEELRRLITVPHTRPRPEPVPRATPPPPTTRKERVSVGPPSAERSKGPMVLRRDDDLNAVPKGTPDTIPGTPSAPRAWSPAPPAAPARASEADGTLRSPGLKLPPGLGDLPRGDEGSRKAGPSQPASIASAARDYVEGRLRDGGPRGLPSGSGQQMGALFFDPEGADFTVWINHFKNEVYRNWIVPQPALLGSKGDVDLAFVVARGGTLLQLTLLRSSGTASLDRAAQNALQGSRLLPLPADYGPSEITMRVRFTYG